MDFTRRRMELSADVGVSVRPIRLVWIVLRAGGSLLKWFLGFRRLASPPPVPEEGKAPEKTDGAPEEAA